MELSQYTYFILFGPGIFFGSITVFRLWKDLGKLDNPWKYRCRFLRIFFVTTLIAWVMDYLLIYFEAWTFPEHTHLWNLPVWPSTTFYGNPFIIPVEEYLLFNTLITWFVEYLLVFQITVSNDTSLIIRHRGADWGPEMGTGNGDRRIIQGTRNGDRRIIQGISYLLR